MKELKLQDEEDKNMQDIKNLVSAVPENPYLNITTNQSYSIPSNQIEMMV